MNYIVTYHESGLRCYELFRSLKIAKSLRDDLLKEKKDRKLAIRDIYLAKIIK